MEYSIGFKIDESIKIFNLHTLVLTPNKQIGIIDYEPNKNTSKIKVRIKLNDDSSTDNYFSCEKKDLVVVIPFVMNNECKEYKIKNPENYIIFKHKNDRFKENDLEFDNDNVLFIPNKKYENPNLEQCLLYLEDKYKFSSTSDAYAINMVINELYKLKYGINKSDN